MKTAWASTIEGPYARALINSERGLQVQFCARLLPLLESKNFRMFVEPTLLFSTSQWRCPDLLVCDAKQIIGVVEFKYTPRTIPKYAKDFETLAMLAQAKDGEITLANERFRGPAPVRRYSVAGDAVLCWAAVHRDAAFEVDSECLSDIQGRYLELRAEAGPDKVRVLTR